MIWLQAGLIFTVLVVTEISSILTIKIRSEKVYSYTNSTRRILALIALTSILFLRYSNIGLILLDIGVFLNIVVMVSNNGYMPVDMNKFKKSICLSDGSDPSDEVVQKMFREVQRKERQHTAMSDNTKFNILGDRHGYSVQSIGDILIFTGILLISFEIAIHLTRII